MCTATCEVDSDSMVKLQTRHVQNTLKFDCNPSLVATSLPLLSAEAVYIKRLLEHWFQTNAFSQTPYLIIEQLTIQIFRNVFIFIPQDLLYALSIRGFILNFNQTLQILRFETITILCIVQNICIKVPLHVMEVSFSYVY